MSAPPLIAPDELRRLLLEHGADEAALTAPFCAALADDLAALAEDVRGLTFLWGVYRSGRHGLKQLQAVHREAVRAQREPTRPAIQRAARKTAEGLAEWLAELGPPPLRDALAVRDAGLVRLLGPLLPSSAAEADFCAKVLPRLGLPASPAGTLRNRLAPARKKGAPKIVQPEAENG